LFHHQEIATIYTHLSKKAHYQIEREKREERRGKIISVSRCNICPLFI